MKRSLWRIWWSILFGLAGWVKAQDGGPSPGDAASAYVIAEVLQGDTHGRALSALDGLYEAGCTRLSAHGEEVIPPMDPCWVFFCDDEPSANWAHACRYIFVAPDLSFAEVREAQWPLEASGAGAGPFLFGLRTVIPYRPKATAGGRRTASPRGTTRGLDYGTGGSHYYAVIISGGQSTNGNSDRYWRDASLAYSTLVGKYGYPKSNMYVLVADGTNPAVDQFDYVSSYTGGTYLTSTPVDFDGDGIADITGEASAVNVSNTFLELQARLTPQDQLLVFTTDHGGPIEGRTNEWDVLLSLWNREKLTDKDMKALTTNLPCPVIFLFEQCYSGGFLDDLNQPDRIVLTAAAHDRSSYAKTPYPYGYDSWAYNVFAALRGFFPSNFTPWVDGEPCDADYNEDGRVSFQEAHRFAMDWKDMDTPQYQENPYYSGHHTFPVRVPDGMLTDSIDGFVLNAVPSPRGAGYPFPFTVEARNVFNRRMTNYAAAVQVQAVSDDWDEGIYYGTATVDNYGYPICCSYWSERVQMIIPASELPGARVLTNAAVNALQVPSMPLSQWTIRMKHTELDEYPTNAGWETSGWTVVYQTEETVTATGWVPFAFSTPFDFNGTNNLMVDFSYSNTTNDYGAICGADNSEKYRTLQYAAYEPMEEVDPLVWSGTNPPPERTTEFPILRFGPLPVPLTVAVQPTNLTGFTDGVWTGALTLLHTSPNMRLRVTAPQTNIFELSNEFMVKDYLFEMDAAEVGAEGGYTLHWRSGTGETYRVCFSTNLLENFQPLATNLAATPPTNSWAVEVATGSVFFCIETE